MKRFKLLLLSTATTLFVSAGIIGLHSTHVFADTLSDIPGNTTKIEVPETPIHTSNKEQAPTSFAAQLPNKGQAPTNFATSKLSSDFYVYNIDGVKRVQYGTSGLGRPLYYYKIGNGDKTLFATFAIHGFEDSWAQDGYQLTKIAHQLIEKFNTKNKTSGLNGWSVIIVPCANPDGILDGWTNNGPGRTQISKKIDLNRDFPTFFKPEYSPRNYTGPNPLGAPEAKDLATLVAKISRESKNMVLLDTHGWLDMTIGDPQIGKPFINNLGLSRNASYIPSGHGYFVSYGHAEGAEVSLVELPDTTSASQVTSRNYTGKMYTAMNEVMNGGTGFEYLNKTGVVSNTSKVNIRSGATTAGSILGSYSRGTNIKIVGKINGWYKIHDSNIGYAYVSAQYVTLTGDSGSKPTPPTPPVYDGVAGSWNFQNGVWTYCNENGTRLTGWQFIKNSWYYLGTNGTMLTGWNDINGSWYYLNSSGAMLTGWNYIGNYWFYFNTSGAMQSGWTDINNTWYYLTDSGAMASGWQEINNNWHYLNSDGAMLTGWQFINNSWFYLRSDGVMLDGWQFIDNAWYHLNNSGILDTGWMCLDNTWYYSDNSGVMQTGWLDLNGSKFHMNSNGSMSVNTTIDGYKIDSNGYATKVK